MEGRSDWGRYDFGTFRQWDVSTMGRFDCKALIGCDLSTDAISSKASPSGHLSGCLAA